VIALLLSLAVASPARHCSLPKIEAGLQRTYDNPDGAIDTKTVHDTLLHCYRSEGNAEAKAHEGYLLVRFDAFAIDYFMRKNLDESVLAESREMGPVFRALPSNSPWFTRAKPLWEPAQEQVSLARASLPAGIHP